MNDNSNWYWKVGMHAFYHLRGRWIHGPQFRYPAMRFAGVPEHKLKPHLYLNWTTNGDGPEQPVREARLVPKHNGTTVDQLARVQDGQPFNIYGTTRADPPEAFKVVGQG